MLTITAIIVPVTISMVVLLFSSEVLNTVKQPFIFVA
jgi:hypothetical protein